MIRPTITQAIKRVVWFTVLIFTAPNPPPPRASLDGPRRREAAVALSITGENQLNSLGDRR
jgi:hypothetical protein